MSEATKDLLTGSAIAIFGGLVYLVVIPAGVAVPATLPAAAVAPDLWPRVASAMLVAVGAMLIADALQRRNGPLDSPSDTLGSAGSLRAGVCIVGLVAYCAALPWFGFPLSSVLALLGLSTLFGERRLKIVVPLAVLVPLALYWFFTKVANVPVPLGELFE